jgi:hypothetical protein
MSSPALVSPSHAHAAPPALHSSLGDKAADAVAAALNSSALHTAGRIAAGALVVGIAMETGTVLDAADVAVKAGELALDDGHSGQQHQPHQRKSKPVTGDDVRAFARGAAQFAATAAEFTAASLRETMTIGLHFIQDANSGEVGVRDACFARAAHWQNCS